MRGTWTYPRYVHKKWLFWDLVYPGDNPAQTNISLFPGMVLPQAVKYFGKMEK
jgi:hypothetical protein